MEFEDPTIEKEYIEYRMQEIQKNLNIFLNFIAFSVGLVAIATLEIRAALFCVLEIIFKGINNRYHYFSSYLDILLSIVVGFSYAIDH